LADESPVISVVIPVLNVATTIGAQLDALLAQETNFSFEVVVADNGSGDGTRTIVERYAESDTRIRFIDASGVALGGSAAKNLGVKAATAPLIGFCDGDDLVAPGWLRAIREGLDRGFDVVEVRKEYWKLNPSRRGRGRQWSDRQSFYGVPVVAGGAFGIRRDLFLELGGFDEGMRGEVDTEFSLRLHEHTGAAPHLLSDAVIHVRMPTGLTVFRRSRALAKSVPALRRRLGFGRGKDLQFAARRILWLVRHLPGLRSSVGQDDWLRVAGSLVGDLEGILGR
jgi:glycosyltransferase involved in cell wall biosynthesis